MELYKLLILPRTCFERSKLEINIYEVEQKLTLALNEVMTWITKKPARTQ